MKSIIILSLLLLMPSENQNYLISKKYIANEISLNEFLAKFDTTSIALQNFIDTSVEQNMIDTVLKMTKGPIEFASIVDSLFENFGKTGQPEILKFINAIEDFSDGYIAEMVAVTAASYCDKYPIRFKKTIIQQGKRSWILYAYLFVRGSNWRNGLMFMSKSQYDKRIIEWAETIIRSEN